MIFIRKYQHHFIEMADSFSGFSIKGADAERFLNGQLTNDVKTIGENRFQLQARLDRGGRLLTFLYLLKSENEFKALVPTELAEEFRADLDKYIIMDDVEIAPIENNFKAIITPVLDLSNTIDPDSIKSQYLGEMGFLPVIISECRMPRSWEKMSPEEFQFLMLVRGEPVLNITAPQGSLVTDTVVNLNGVSLQKGCFLGQETVAKIETRRGGAHFPMIINVNKELNLSFGQEVLVGDKKAGKVLKSFTFENQSYVLISLLRNFRVEGRSFDFVANGHSFSGVVRKLPLGNEFNAQAYLEEKYEEAVHLFQNDKTEQAMRVFNHIIEVDPKHENALESLGVILGRLERFEEGISLMDQVLEANPDSVMAHTNKSLFLMRLGKIEEAEEEKAQATVKSFNMFGKRAQEDKVKEEAEKQKKAQVQRRMEMFKEVLEMDPDDELANYGLADVFYAQGEAIKSLPLLEKVLKNNPKYSVAYLLLGKVYENLSKINEAKDIYNKGIEVASAQGDMMPANEMQARLSNL